MVKGILKSGEHLTWPGMDLLHRLFIISLITLMTGCATADRSVNFLYQPTAFGSGGSGDLYLSQSIQPLSNEHPVEWIIGAIKNGSGKETGNIVTDRPPVETVMDAFFREFKAAGYNVIPVDVLPDGVAKGIRITTVSIGLEEFDRVYKVESRCSVKVSIEPWRDGAAIKRLDYESSYEDATFLDRDMILLKSEQMALQQLMARAVREAILLIEKR